MLVRRDTRRGADDLITVYRPCRLDELLGNDINKKVIKNFLDKQNVPHTMFFTGPSGCGKTTAARIIALGLNCEEGISSKPCLKCSSCDQILNSNGVDVEEINVGMSGTKGDVSGIVKNLAHAPFSARTKIKIFDEAHRLTPASIALLLKVLEDGYKHVYFIFCTDQPEVIKAAAFHGRANMARLNFGRLADSMILDLLINVCQYEGVVYNEDVLNYITNKSEGVSRDSLGWLNVVINEGTWDLSAAKELITGHTLDENNPKVIDLCRSLVKSNWPGSLDAFKALSAIKGFNVESTRIHVANYFVGCLKKEKGLVKATKFSLALDALNAPIYDQGKTAENKFYNCMFKVVKSMRAAGK